MYAKDNKVWFNNFSCSRWESDTGGKKRKSKIDIDC